jgi:hypothetical protein
MKQLPALQERPAGKIATTGPLNEVIRAVNGMAEVHQVGMADDPVAGGVRLPLFGVLQSYGSNVAVLKPCTCVVTWPFDEIPPAVYRLVTGKVYAYLPLPRGKVNTTVRGTLLPVSFGTGC